jgi:hypothetical protein
MACRRPPLPAPCLAIRDRYLLLPVIRTLCHNTFASMCNIMLSDIGPAVGVGLDQTLGVLHATGAGLAKTADANSWKRVEDLK